MISQCCNDFADCWWTKITINIIIDASLEYDQMFFYIITYLSFTKWRGRNFVGLVVSLHPLTRMQIFFSLMVVRRFVFVCLSVCSSVRLSVCTFTWRYFLVFDFWSDGIFIEASESSIKVQKYEKRSLLRWARRFGKNDKLFFKVGISRTRRLSEYFSIFLVSFSFAGLGPPLRYKTSWVTSPWNFLILGLDQR